jgi:F0F1-type ATP synthase assembly protein I
MSDEPKRSRAIRLALSMLSGVLIGYVFSPGPGNALDHWDRAPPETYTVGGALIGLAVGIALNSRAKREKPCFN